MSAVEITPVSPGGTTSASATNAAYSALATASGAIAADNLARQSITRAHLEDDTFLAFSGNSINVSTTGTYTSTSYTLVSHGTDMDVPVGIAIEDGQVVRCHANVFVTEGTQDGADTDAALFKFKFYWDLGAGYVAMDNITYQYTYAVRDETGLGTISTYKNRRLGFSLLYIHSGASVTPVSIQVRIAMGSAINSVTLKQTGLSVLVFNP